MILSSPSRRLAILKDERSSCSVLLWRCSGTVNTVEDGVGDISGRGIEGGRGKWQGRALLRSRRTCGGAGAEANGHRVPERGVCCFFAGMVRCRTSTPMWARVLLALGFHAPLLRIDKGNRDDPGGTPALSRQYLKLAPRLCM